MESDSDSESYVRQLLLSSEEEEEEEGLLTDPETGEEQMASGDARAAKVKGPLESEKEEEETFRTGSSVRSEEPWESSSDEEVTLSREVMEYGETGDRSDMSRNVTRNFPLAGYGDIGRARERERKPGRVGRRPTPLVRVYYTRQPYREHRRYLQEQTEEDRETLREYEKVKEREKQEREKQKQKLDPKEGPSGRKGIKDLCKSVLLDRPDS